MKKKNIHCFVAGRSGGHIIPALTLAHQARATKTATDILFFSTDAQLDKKIIGASSDVTWHVPLAFDGLPKNPLHLFRFVWQLSRSFFSSLRHLKKHRPDFVLSTGGYVALPVFLAARLLRIPVELFELNAVPGKATKVLSSLARTFHVCFEETKKFLPQKKCKLRPYPIRYTENKKTQTETPASEKKTILIVGGSQGSVSINNTIKKLVTDYPHLHKQIELIHQTGAIDTTDWKTWYQQRNMTAVTEDFFCNVQPLYHKADLVICRSGAGSLFETLFFKKPCITIPIETKKNTHQVDNALALQKQYPKRVTVVRHHELKNNVEKLFQEIKKQL